MSEEEDKKEMERLMEEEGLSPKEAYKRVSNSKEEKEELKKRK